MIESVKKMLLIQELEQKGVLTEYLPYGDGQGNIAGFRYKVLEKELLPDEFLQEYLKTGEIRD